MHTNRQFIVETSKFFTLNLGQPNSSWHPRESVTELIYQVMSEMVRISDMIKSKNSLVIT